MGMSAPSIVFCYFGFVSKTVETQNFVSLLQTKASLKMKIFAKTCSEGICLVTALLLFSPQASYGQTGTIKGTLRDASNQNPLIGANIMLAGTNMGAASDSEGQFVIPRVPVGQYTLNSVTSGIRRRL